MYFNHICRDNCVTVTRRGQEHIFCGKFSISQNKFPDLFSCNAMANPGEEMVCGQCGQTILGKAMKVFVSSSSCMLIIIFTVQVFIFILTFTNCRQEYHLICHRIPSIPILKNHLEINANRLVRSIGTSITSSAATVE